MKLQIFIKQETFFIQLIEIILIFKYYQNRKESRQVLVSPAMKSMCVTNRKEKTKKLFYFFCKAIILVTSIEVPRVVITRSHAWVWRAKQSPKNEILVGMGVNTKINSNFN